MSIRKPAGFWQGAGIPESARANTFEECGCCGAFHRTDFAGDCREKNERYWYYELPDDAVLIYPEDETSEEAK